MLVINSINDGIASSIAQFCSLVPDVTIGSLGMRLIILANSATKFIIAEAIYPVQCIDQAAKMHARGSKST